MVIALKDTIYIVLREDDSVRNVIVREFKGEDSLSPRTFFFLRVVFRSLTSCEVRRLHHHIVRRESVLNDLEVTLPSPVEILSIRGDKRLYGELTDLVL